MSYFERKLSTKILILFIIVSLISVKQIYAQKLNIVEVAGRISSFNNDPVKYAKIKLNSYGKTAISDVKGMFSIFAAKGDTINIHCIGYSSFKIKIPDSIAGMLFYLDVPLAPDTVVIDPVVLFPWKTYPEFKAAVLAFQPAVDKDIKNAMNNFALICAQAMQYEEADPASNFRYVVAQQANTAGYKGMNPTTSLLNPFAWVSFYKSVKNGSMFNSSNLAPLKDENRKKIKPNY
jgi:hypothetical protein